MKLRNRHNSGIGVMELLVAVVLISVIAAAGISTFQYMVLRAHRSEGKIFIEQIHSAELAYHAEWDTFTNAGPSPVVTPGRSMVVFSPTAAWQNLGWVPPRNVVRPNVPFGMSNVGKVRGKYQVTMVPGVSRPTDNFNASAVLDVDGDGTEASYTCNRARKSKMRSGANVY